MGGVLPEMKKFLSMVCAVALAALCAVPAFSAVDIGFDRSMIGAYGHDDRVCAYAR